ncbi:amino acid adenylation domain-containing protein, partial [Chryseobacterium cucumeris]
GRNDFQVKIRGHRIELGEIESVLITYSAALTQVIVDIQEENGEKVLVAYYVCQNDIDKSSLRSFLQGELPEYMIPNYYVELESLPLTPNGKVDRKSLPGISGSDVIRGEYVAPTSVEEKKLVEIWQRILKVEGIGITDNFFELGGHSLIIGQVINHVFKELGQRLSFRDFFSSPTISGLCEKLKASDYVSIPLAEESSSYPLTSSQNRLWILSQFEGGSAAYNMSVAVSFKGSLNHSYLQTAFRRLIDRHEILRTRFRVTASGEVVQHVVASDEIEFDIAEQDFSSIVPYGDALEEYLQSQNNKPFDLTQAPLIRGSLARLEDNHHVFLLSIHHIIGDGWSMEIVVSEFVKIYNSLLTGVEPGLSDLRIQFKDYAVWINSESQQQILEESAGYWLNQFNGDLPVLELAGYRPRPLQQSYTGSNLVHSFSEDFLIRLKRFSQEHDVSLFMTLMAGVNLLLYRYTNQDDIILGTPIAGRAHQDLENQVGLYLNTLAIRTRFDGNGNFQDLLSREKQVLLEAYDHQGYPLDELIGKLDLTRDMSRSALFDVLVVLQGQADNISSGEALIDLEVSGYDFSNKSSKFDLTYSFSERDTLTLSITYNTDLYESSFIESMFTHFENLLSLAIETPSISLCEIDYLTPEEKDQLLNRFNTPVKESFQGPGLLESFELQARINPKGIALVFEDKKVSYEELLNEVNALSSALLNKGVRKGENIILCFEHHLERGISGMLGILKAGGVYVPVDADYPVERLGYIIEDTNARYVLSNSIDGEIFTPFDIEVLALDQQDPFCVESYEAPIGDIQSGNAYIIYTSGSTGMPKGVLVSHQNIIDYVYGLSSTIDIESNRSFGLMSTISTDLGNTVLFSSLVFGKELHLFTKNKLRNVEYIQNYFLNTHVDCIKIVPSYWRALELGSAAIQNLKMIIFGGEELSIELVRSVLVDNPALRIINHYGPTETTIGKLLHQVDPSHDYYRIPVGRPFSSTQCYIVDSNLSLCPKGVIGELLIGGDGVSEGYLNNTSLTSEKFITDVFTGGSGRLYRTGDRVMMHPNGDIEFRGRIDTQVKILGHRIELGEIERIINSYEGVSSSVVDAVDVGESDRRLVAYIAYEYAAVEKSLLFDYLRTHLPAIMIPSVIVNIKEIPLTSNGKVNRRALPSINAEDILNRAYVAPQDAVEIKLAEIWQEVLKVERVGVTDNFFELGGNSLKV